MSTQTIAVLVSPNYFRPPQRDWATRRKLQPDTRFPLRFFRASLNWLSGSIIEQIRIVYTSSGLSLRVLSFMETLPRVESRGGGSVSFDFRDLLRAERNDPEKLLLGLFA